MLGLPVERKSRAIPFGYQRSGYNPKVIEPVDLEFEVLVEAKKYWNESSYTELAAWVVKHTGRQITNWGLQKLMETRCPDDAAALTRAEREEIYNNSVEEYDRRRGQKNEVFSTRESKDKKREKSSSSR
jgi:hypothetical protein